MAQYPNPYVYSRKTAPGGSLAKPNEGNPSFVAEIEANLPGKKFRVVADAVNVTAYFEVALTAGEETTLTQAHTDWTPGAIDRYAPNYEVKTISKGQTVKVEWFQTDNGDGTYADLAASHAYNWTGSTLTSIVKTAYYTDGGIASQETESFYTVSGNPTKFVKKVT